jgi:hypothetical protein
MARDLASQGDPRFWWRFNNGHRHGHRGHGHHHHDHDWDFDDDDVAAGIIGFAAGAIAGGALAPPRYVVPSGHVARCKAEYQSYDVRTDTYLGYDGDRHYCRL